MVFGKVVHFFQILLELENSVATAYKSQCKQTIISLERTVNFLYRTFALLLMRYKALKPRSTISHSMDGAGFLLIMPFRAVVDRQLLQIK